MVKRIFLINRCNWRVFESHKYLKAIFSNFLKDIGQWITRTSTKDRLLIGNCQSRINVEKYKVRIKSVRLKAVVLVYSTIAKILINDETTKYV